LQKVNEANGYLSEPKIENYSRIKMFLVLLFSFFEHFKVFIISNFLVNLFFVFDFIIIQKQETD